MATHSSVLAWRIPGMEEPSGLPSVESHRVRNNLSDLAAAAAYTHIRRSSEYLLGKNIWLVYNFPDYN